MTLDRSLRRLRALAALVGGTGLLVLLLGVVDAYQTGVAADQNMTTGSFTVLQVAALVVGPVLVVLAALQLRAVRALATR